jgi:hypothetical protein
MDAAERLTPVEFESRLVEEIERLVPDGAAALFHCDADAEILTRRAAGPRWRTAERDVPCWLGPYGRPLAQGIRSAASLIGEMTFVAARTREVLVRELVQVPVVVDGHWWGALVLLRPAGALRRTEDVWMVGACARHVSDALSGAARASSAARVPEMRAVTA